MEKEAKALYTVREVSRMTGVSVRTLHYYDQKGLLRPDRSEAGYRLYGAQALSRLQQLLFFRELDFTLAQIKQFLDGAAYDQEEILTRQKALLTLRRERLDRLRGRRQHRRLSKRRRRDDLDGRSREAFSRL